MYQQQRNKNEDFLRKSNAISTVSLFILFLVYIILSEFKFSVYTVIIMVVITAINIILFTYFKYKIHIGYKEENINIMDYVSSDLSWRYLIYLSLFFVGMVLVENFVLIIREYSYMIVLNAFIFFIWALSLNNPMVTLLIKKSVQLKDIFIVHEVSELSLEMGIETPSIYILNTGNRIANAFEINSREAYVFITSYLMNILDYNEIIAVLAHELSHIKLKHNRKTALINFGVYIIVINVAALGFVFNIGILLALSPFFFIFLIVFLFLIIPAIKRRNEVAADLNAVRYVKKEYLESALIKISNIENIPENVMKSLSLDHPATSKRIEIIEKSKS
ncbi:M48 family metallopeptidase [Acidiplasma cupricumulans]|jgi:STE24 endopeptidase|uniref:Peptidase M48 domain-containing protein n=1 Tax=Acidiplasma cupricumulans TaxID=312540 RepID=A0A0N8VKH4_9ARCH|nr:M56 family metallopeptidase [Acidiplasma cupricumulans]KQB33732.1 hypothetical protein AOG55_02135 [Acidiplasma cupricumulans]